MDERREGGREGGLVGYVPNDAASSFCLLPAGDTAGMVGVVRLEGGEEGGMEGGRECEKAKWREGRREGGREGGRGTYPLDRLGYFHLGSLAVGTERTREVVGAEFGGEGAREGGRGGEDGRKVRGSVDEFVVVKRNDRKDGKEAGKGKTVSETEGNGHLRAIRTCRAAFACALH